MHVVHPSVTLQTHPGGIQSDERRLIGTDRLERHHIGAVKLCVIVEPGIEVKPSLSVAVAIAEQSGQLEGQLRGVARSRNASRDKWVGWTAGKIVRFRAAFRHDQAS
jgi:hypothetical protein